jgi:hypothetical protein
MPLSGMLTCGSCGARTQISQMRYNLGGTKLICSNCVDKERGTIKPGTTHSPAAVRMQKESNAKTEQTQSRPAASQVNTGGMAGYYCRNCHFKFSRRRDIDVTNCPYCGKDSVAPAYEGRAQDLIEESSRRKDDDDDF